ncbi:MAG: hypothetical protein ACXWCY_21500 [Burkholderiales bacterium]
MKSTHTIAIGVLTALSLGLAASAQAQTAGAGPGTMEQMMHGQSTGAAQHGGMAGHQGHMAAQQGAIGQQQHAGPMSGGCPMTSMMSQHGAPPTTQK